MRLDCSLIVGLVGFEALEQDAVVLGSRVMRLTRGSRLSPIIAEALVPTVPLVARAFIMSSSVRPMMPRSWLRSERRPPHRTAAERDFRFVEYPSSRFPFYVPECWRNRFGGGMLRVGSCRLGATA